MFVGRADYRKQLQILEGIRRNSRWLFVPFGLSHVNGVSLSFEQLLPLHRAPLESFVLRAVMVPLVASQEL